MLSWQVILTKTCGEAGSRLDLVVSRLAGQTCLIDAVRAGSTEWMTRITRHRLAFQIAAGQLAGVVLDVIRLHSSFEEALLGALGHTLHLFAFAVQLDDFTTNTAPRASPRFGTRTHGLTSSIQLGDADTSVTHRITGLADALRVQILNDRALRNTDIAVLKDNSEMFTHHKMIKKRNSEIPQQEPLPHAITS